MEGRRQFYLLSGSLESEELWSELLEWLWVCSNCLIVLCEVFFTLYLAIIIKNWVNSIVRDCTAVREMHIEQVYINISFHRKWRGIFDPPVTVHFLSNSQSLAKINVVREFTFIHHSGTDITKFRVFGCKEWCNLY